MELAVVAAAAALRLSPADVLCGGTLHLHRGARTVCRLGQAGTPRYGQGRGGALARSQEHAIVVDMMDAIIGQKRGARLFAQRKRVKAGELDRAIAAPV